MRAVLAADAAAIYMGAGEAAQIAAALIAAGKPRATPAAVVENASLPDSKIVRGTLEQLPSLAQAMSGGPALILLGEVFAAAHEADVGDLIARIASQAA